MEHSDTGVSAADPKYPRSADAECVELHPERFREREQLHVGDAPGAQLDPRDQRAIHIPTRKLEPPSEVILRPASFLPDTPNPRPEDISELEIVWRFAVRHFRRLTVGGTSQTRGVTGNTRPCFRLREPDSPHPKP